MAVEVIPYFPGTTGKILDLVTPDTGHWGIHACQTFAVGYNLPAGTDPPGDTIPALTSATVLSTGGLNGRTTFDPTVGNWVVITVPSTRGLWATPLEEIAQLPTLVSHPYYAILQWVERGVVRPWQWTQTLPPGQRGDILRHDGVAWQVYPLSAGPPGSLLFNDQAGSGLPIWRYVVGIGPPAGGTTVLQSGTDARVLDLGTNHSAAFGAGSPPPGWQLPDFDDTGWAHGVVSESAPYVAPIIWSTAGALPFGECLFRGHFAVPALTAIGGATLKVQVDDAFQAYFNGTFLGGDTSYPAAPQPVIYDVFHLIRPGDNVLAVYGKNDDDTEGAGVAYVATIS